MIRIVAYSDELTKTCTFQRQKNVLLTTESLYRIIDYVKTWTKCGFTVKVRWKITYGNTYGLIGAISATEIFIKSKTDLKRFQRFVDMLNKHIAAPYTNKA